MIVVLHQHDGDSIHTDFIVATAWLGKKPVS